MLYFYPKDETPGCTTEACEFRDNVFAFRDLNAQIIGVSLDDVESHKAFAENHGLPFPLLADVEGKAATAYGVKTRMLGMPEGRSSHRRPERSPRDARHPVNGSNR